MRKRGNEMYSKNIQAALEKKKIAAGDRVRIASRGKSYSGILIPRAEGGEGETLLLKLESGYNVGIRPDSPEGVEKEPGGGTEPLERTVGKTLSKREGLPKISLVATGGTIASRVDYKLGGVKTVLSPEEIFYNAPELEGIASFEKISRPFTLWSENMSPAEWQKTAEQTANELNSGADGVVVTHGTDTLHFTAAALSFMLQGLDRPVALVGAQRSPDRGSFDGAMNLACACHYIARSQMAEVAIVMHATVNDDYCIAVRGTKARKMHSSRRDAFRPVNDFPLCKIWPDGKIEKLQEPMKKGILKKQGEGYGKVEADTKFEQKVALLKAYPGSPPELIDFLVEKKYKGIVVEATGLGQVPTNTLDKKFSWLPAIRNALEKGLVVAFATQGLYGRTSPFVYETARAMHNLGVVHCEDMLPEVAYVKLGFLLGHKFSQEEVKKKMLENIAGEINYLLSGSHFLA